MDVEGLSRPTKPLRPCAGTSRWLRDTATLPIADGIACRSIIGRNDPDAALETSTDGVVPYSSSHLEGAMSELIVTSGHGVLGTPEAILEVRRTAAVPPHAEVRRVRHFADPRRAAAAVASQQD